MGERRSGFRARSFARILLSVEGRAGFVADVSEGGFRGLFIEPFPVEPGKLLRIGVSFEELGVEPFSVLARACWQRSSAGAFEVGFELAANCGPAELLLFERIRRYYSLQTRKKLDSTHRGC